MKKIIFIAIILIGITNYISYQKGYDKGNTDGVSSGMTIEREYYNDKEGKLNECLLNAKEKFRTSFKLNSVPEPQKDDPNVRRWNSDEIATSVEDQYNKDKEFCLKLYKI